MERGEQRAVYVDELSVTELRGRKVLNRGSLRPLCFGRGRSKWFHSAISLAKTNLKVSVVILRYK